MIKAIIVDWGWVLEDIDMQGFWQKIGPINDIQLEEINKAIKEMDKGNLNSNQYHQKIEKILNKKIDQNYYNQLFFNKYVTLNQELVNFLKELKLKYKLYILSNNTPKFYNHLKDLPFEKIFDKIFLSFQYKLVKPDPKFFNLVIEESKCRPQECIFIDDTLSHIEAAKKLKFNTIHYNNFEQCKKELLTLISLS